VTTAGDGTFEIDSALPDLQSAAANRRITSGGMALRLSVPVVDERYRYVGEPNGATFPAFTAVDLIVFKTFTVRRRSADLGIQLFNAANHFNPRDMYPVTGAARFGTFTNSVGPILRGFMLVKW